jgi:hypothetical protein
MKITRKIGFLTLLLTIGFSIQNCDDCNCPPVDFPFFDVNGIEVNHSTTPASGDAIGDPVTFANYIGISIKYIYTVVANQQPKKNQSNWDFSLMSSAYGCSCLYDGINGSKEEELEKVTIITLNDFDDDHLANDTINDLFVSSIGYLPIDEYLAKDNEKISNLYEDFRLEKAPVLNKNFKAKVIIELSTGEVYEAETVEQVIE